MKKLLKKTAALLLAGALALGCAVGAALCAARPCVEAAEPVARCYSASSA